MQRRKDDGNQATLPGLPRRQHQFDYHIPLRDAGFMVTITCLSDVCHQIFRRPSEFPGCRIPGRAPRNQILHRCTSGQGFFTAQTFIVSAALFGVCKRLVGLRDFIEFFGGFTAKGCIRVELFGVAAIGALDFFQVSLLVNSQEDIEIGHGHLLAWPPCI